MSEASSRIRSYAEFWPYYLREHAKAATRVLHYVGTALVLIIAAWALVSGRPIMLLLLPVAGYFFAWVGHFFVERNKPATFQYPLWSLISDFRMFFAWVTFQLPAELEKAGLDRRAV